jgi:hypothetical protein
MKPLRLYVLVRTLCMLYIAPLGHTALIICHPLCPRGPPAPSLLAE